MFKDRQKITDSNNDSMRIYINTYEFESNYSPSKPDARPDLSGNPSRCHNKTHYENTM